MHPENLANVLISGGRYIVSLACQLQLKIDANNKKGKNKKNKTRQVLGVTVKRAAAYLLDVLSRAPIDSVALLYYGETF